MLKVFKIYGKLITSYYRSFDHPFKLRIIGLINKLFIDKFRYDLVIPYFNGTWIKLDLKEYVDNFIFRNGTYEQEVFDTLISFAVEDEILWDIGSHIGSFSLKALRSHSVKEIHCFEPNPKTFELLTYNKLINGNPEKMQLHKLGIADQDKIISFEQNETGNSGVSKFSYNAPSPDSLKLPVTTIDSLIYNQHFKSPTLIKIDVEGFEKYVFMGGEEFFKTQSIKCIIFETHTNGVIIKDEWIRSFLASHNYIVRYVNTLDELGSPYQNFIAFKPSP